MKGRAMNRKEVLFIIGLIGVVLYFASVGTHEKNSDVQNQVQESAKVKVVRKDLYVLNSDMLDFPPEVRAWYRNPDGSCVQCSIGMCGVWQNTLEASTLLWDSPYGSRVRGGSGPSRVANYSKERGIPIYNITGEGTLDWMKWAIRNGRMVAIGAGVAHFQTLVWISNDPSDKKPFKVCNNNSPTRIDEYDFNSFMRLHLSSGRWVVIIKSPSPPAMPKNYDEWVVYNRFGGDL
jgi:hypothetical protein